MWRVQVKFILMTNIVYLSLGSNIGKREDHLREAIAGLENIGAVESVSSFYETEPVEFTEQPLFLNCAVKLDTWETPTNLMAKLLKIERRLGRQRIQKKGPRTIDIDILLYGVLVMDTPDLTIPHPEMAARRFVLTPLSEIAPEVKHPVFRKTVQQLLNELPDGQKVWKF